MMIINMVVNYFETRPDYLVLLLAFAQGIYGWLSEEEIFPTIVQWCVGAAFGWIFVSFVTIFIGVKASLAIILIYFIYLLFQAKKERDDPYNWH